jgi:cystathionine beta-lyase
LKIHLQNNFLLLENFAQRYPEFITLTPIEGTYLAWLDCRGMQMSNRQLRTFFTQEAKLGLNPGLSFGRNGSGFMRLNFAVSSVIMQEIIARLESAFMGMKNGTN